MNEQVILILCLGGMFAAVVWTIVRALTGDDDQKIRQRLSAVADEPRSQGAAGARQSVLPLLQKVSQFASKPFMPTSRERLSGLRRTLAYAGIYTPLAVRLVVGAKVICLLLGLLGGYVAGIVLDQVWLSVSLGGIAGYLLPRLWLRVQVNRNQRALTVALPDALDLMVVCVEAGLTVDAAMQRVGQELGLAHPTLSRELGITHMETRVGLSRVEALRNLGVRTGNAAIQSLSAMLIQAERFGTSIAEALRIHAESLRQRRQYIAEELAAKAAVKLSFPLVLFIFPATFIVLAGPTVIGLLNSPLFQD